MSRIEPTHLLSLHQPAPLQPLNKQSSLLPLDSRIGKTPAQPKGPAAEEEEAGRDVAVQFASLLISMVVKQMWMTTSIDGAAGEGPFGSGPGADIYQGLAEGAFAEALARNGMETLTGEVMKHIRKGVPKPENGS
ncbi:MAG: hypothetical protein V2A76_11740 [Planctomycetota bacterium]